MCGILALFQTELSIQECLNLLELLKHRGPDSTGYSIINSNFLGHKRLSINDVSNGKQPFVTKEYILIVNGEIYNHENIRKTVDYEFKSNSDCEVIIPLYKRLEISFK